tara:strand:- start:677 stop:1027 length:351 start_codon:yes stop_codon:yes gene_type:complete
MPIQGRYDNIGIISLSKREMFKQVKSSRNLDEIRILSTSKFNRITDSDLEDIEFDSYTWSRGDRFYKLAADFYGQVDYWWVIALFNNAPTEQHVTIGTEIFIPTNPESVAELLGVE